MLILIVYFSSLAKSQNSRFLDAPHIVSPEIATLGSYGSFSSSLYTGHIDISVPLYTIDFEGKNIPIYIQYDASGFLPNKESGMVGQNWNLSSGGVITRKVNGVPDEYYDIPQGGTMQVNAFKNGYWYGINRIGQSKSGDIIKNLTYINFSNPNYVDLPYEHTPDIFSFNFCGYTGRFVIGNDGKVKVISNGHYEIDLSGLSFQTTNISSAGMAAMVKSSKIIIVADDGFKYTFGGEINCLEINLDKDFADENTQLPNGTGIISAWHLTKIESPSGKAIEFNYQTQDFKEVFKTALTLKDASIDRTYFHKVYYMSDIRTLSPVIVNSPVPIEAKKIAFIKPAYLSAIKMPSGKVSFKYSEKARDRHFYGEDRITYWKTNNRICNTMRLDSILVENSKNDSIRKIRFNYQYYKAINTTSCYRMFLNGLKINDQVYSFKYNDVENLPKPLINKIDKWGYYNNATRSAFELYLVRGSDNLPTIDLSNRDTDPQQAVKGMIHEIVYPTGGYTRFTFESHDYSNVVKFPSTQSIEPSVVKTAKNMYAGGTRIKQVLHYPENKAINYEYITDTDKMSSGIICDNKVFHIYNSRLANGQIYELIQLFSFDLAESLTLRMDPYITYSHVIERINNNSGGFSRYQYTSHLSDPDIYTLSSNTVVISLADQRLTGNFLSQMQKFITPSSNEISRGKLKYRHDYDSNLNMVAQEEYEYKRPDLSFATYTYDVPVKFADKSGLFHSYAFFHYPTYMTKKTRTQQGVYTIETFDYDEYKRLKTSSISNSVNGTKTKTYAYPTTEKALVDKKMISTVIQVNDTHNGNPVGVVKTVYPSTTIYPGSTQWSATSASTIRTEVTYDKYDANGNILQYTGLDGIPVSCVWSYNNEYVVAEFKNMPYSEAFAIMNLHLGIDITKQNNLTEDIAKKLRTLPVSSSIPDKVQVTTYTYKPLVGMTSTTAPNGITTYYNYDSFGRLQEIYILENNIKKLIKEYQYNYKIK